MKQVFVFAGTTEGYEIADYLQQRQVTVQAYTATKYGGRSLREDAYLTIRSERLTAREMQEEIQTHSPQLVIDATHPYAAEVTKNIQSACANSDCPYLRLLRGKDDQQTGTVYVEDIAQAVSYLAHTDGNILLTTGSKELKAFTALPDYQNRLYARVLSLPSVISACAALGLEGKHLLGMQGPFSKELNVALLRQYRCKYLVTKDTGKQGGFLEKYEAALECGCTPVVIGRPTKETGFSMTEIKNLLKERLGLFTPPFITLAGIGMGAPATMTAEVKDTCQKADVIIGAKRLADAAALPGQPVYYAYDSEEIAAYIKAHPEYERIVIALSGDVGFYSGATKLIQRLQISEILCGISSLAYFMAKIGLSWEDARLTSAHGRSCNLAAEIRRYPKVFSILGTKDGVADLARKLVEFDMGEVLLYVGEYLSYPQEKIFHKPAHALINYPGNALSVICAIHPGAQKSPATHGLPDTAFLRGKAPMTKEEVRAVSLAKLRLYEDSICYDVGAGTGSVAVEMALRTIKGTVYAVEKNPEAVALLRENRRKFALEHLHIIEGIAPKVLENVESPTHAFIGGSSGNLADIMEILLQKNKKVRIVINCITLETVTEALAAIKSLHFSYVDIAQVSVAKSKNVGCYHMMMGENPIYILTCANEE